MSSQTNLIRIVSWYVNGLCKKSANFHKFYDAEFCKDVYGHDIVGLVEMHCSPDD